MRMRIAAGFIGALISSQAGATEEFPALNMHVFNDDSHLLEQPRPALPPLAANDSSSFQMVVFSDEAAADAPAYSESVAAVGDDDEFSFYYEIGTGYQRDDISWSVASPTPSGAPNPALEADWQAIDLWRLNAQFDIKTPLGLVLKGNATYGRVIDGTVEQVSYAGDNRTRPYAPVTNVSDEGYILGGSIAAGYRFAVANQFVQASLTPLGGYAALRQRLAVSNNPKSHYAAEWTGPWLGVDGSVSWLEAHELFASFEQHWANYDAEAKWRQGDVFSQPLSFKHQADATGWKGLFGYRYRVADVWGMSLTFDYQKWDADSGSERAYLSNGVQVDSRLNEVSRASMGVNLGLNMRF